MKWMLIIGGNSDIGFELSKRFAGKNFNIYLASKNISQLKFKKKYLEKNFNINNEFKCGNAIIKIIKPNWIN